MNQIQGYYEAPAYTGEGMALPAGKYVCVIKGAKEVTSQKGNKQLVLMLDIAEGDYKGYYSDRYARDLEKNSNAKWSNGGIYRQNVEGNSLPYFRGLMTCIEKSNPGYTWDWNEKGLAGKKIGVLFGREEFMTDNGKRWATKAMGVRSIEGLEGSQIPKDKPLQEKDTFNMNDFKDMDSEDDLPF